MTRPKTRPEMQEAFLAELRSIATYWGSDAVRSRTVQERCEGVIFSTLVLLDGHSGAHMPWALVPVPGPDDREEAEREGRTWYPVLTRDEEAVVHRLGLHGGAALHDAWYQTPAPEPELEVWAIGQAVRRALTPLLDRFKDNPEARAAVALVVSGHGGRVEPLLHWTRRTDTFFNAECGCGASLCGIAESRLLETEAWHFARAKTDGYQGCRRVEP